MKPFFINVTQEQYKQYELSLNNNKINNIKTVNNNNNVVPADDNSEPDPDPLVLFKDALPVQLISSHNSSLYDIMMNNHPPSWTEFFSSAEAEVLHVCKNISSVKPIFPLFSDILSAFWACPFSILKVVIIGQDPYPGLDRYGRPKANGKAFSGNKYTMQIPDSLSTIYDELERSIPEWTRPKHGDLKCWAKQGVLLYNTALTVEQGNPGSHTGVWKAFTQKFLEYLNENTSNVVFLLWGKPAQKCEVSLFNQSHLKLTAMHPSPMNNHREGRGFVGCNHFVQTNDYLISKGIRPIDWTVE